ncbi:MAG: acyl-CoA-binding protein [Salinisphaeraceae bacterium]|uniref:Acyl-CoA-binding protein n=1 Tax=Spectribacter acetivorans TaxID=3075603 RepID=A0ABU3BAY2_9GAMM|nr:acyl-CoA-binding protein [Salinisphaera sp. P385]MDT0619190.1 acyl-CoA-binding protein [Salinisphaera sp. P385]
MADVTAEFEQAQKDVETLTKRPSNEDLLALYAHYKQATAGDVAGKRPGMTDFKGRAKYDAWAKLKGTDAEAAMRAYIAKVGQLLDAERG